MAITYQVKPQKFYTVTFRGLTASTMGDVIAAANEKIGRVEPDVTIDGETLIAGTVEQFAEPLRKAD